MGEQKRGSSSSVAAPSAASPSYTRRVLGLARAAPQDVLELEAALDAFVGSGKRRDSLPPMPQPQRELAHELAKAHYIVHYTVPPADCMLTAPADCTC